MINKENEDKKPEDKKEDRHDNGFVDTARMDINAHIIIKDKDTGQILVNKRG